MATKIGAASSSGQFVAYAKTDTVHGSLALPADKMVAAMRTLMTELQTRLSPLVTWGQTEHCYSARMMLRWATPTTQLQLETSVDTLNMWVNLHPCFGGPRQRQGTESLATWSVKRCKGDCVMGDCERGQLHISGLTGSTLTNDLKLVQLEHPDPVFDGLKRARPSYELPGADLRRRRMTDHIVEFTQPHITTMFTAA